VLASDPFVDELQLVHPSPVSTSSTLSAAQSMQLFEEAGIDVAPWGLGATVSEVKTLAGRYGWPVVLKNDTDAAVHKALSGGVRLGVGPDDIDEVAASMLMKTRRLLVASQLRPELELFVGIRNDEEF